jgi:hypothetical protein
VYRLRAFFGHISSVALLFGHDRDRKAPGWLLKQNLMRANKPIPKVAPRGKTSTRSQPSNLLLLSTNASPINPVPSWSKLDGSGTADVGTVAWNVTLDMLA